ncbi:esterase-like activity of phytase family protein [Terrarubrum flagellatum]|uniref:esterase-like activity of phytase family protein n=1 Tax=Terrirubrum flagellatum TaxID=2895980 RepID=UPI00314524AB
MRVRSVAAMLIACAAASSIALADGVRFIGAAVIDGTGVDKSGLPSTLLEDGVSPQNGLNGFGSAMAYAGFGNRFVLMPDRGPNKVEYKGGEAVDNTTSYANRFQTFDITVKPNADKPTGFSVEAKHLGTTLLKTAKGDQYVGLSTAFAAEGGNRRLDPEGVRVAPDGSLWVSDEYGPHILHFDKSGRQIGALTPPDGFLIAQPGPNLKGEMAGAKWGRVTNRGAEGLALTPDGRWLVVAMQGALVQDGGAKALHTRLLVYDLQAQDKPPRQYLYPLKDQQHSISEILAVDDHRFLVDERDGKAGAKGSKLLFLIDFNQAQAPTDLATTPYSGREGKALPMEGAPEGVTALKKTLFADVGSMLVEAQEKGLGVFVTKEGLPDKMEGYAFGPDLPNGDFLLLACNDNDFTTQATGLPNYIFAFAVPRDALPGVTLNRLAPGVTFGD